MIVFGAIAPHGGEAFVEGSATWDGFAELGRRLEAAAPDSIVVVTPHNVHVEGHFGVVVATSSLRGRGSHRSLSLAQVPGLLEEAGKARVAFVFGPEKSGLTEEEMSHASVFLRLPTDPGFPTLNVSHAVAVTLAASKLTDDGSRVKREDWAPSADVESMMGHWDRALEAIGFYETGHRDRTLRDIRRLIAGRPLSAREVAILRGVANRVLVSLRRREK